MAPGLSKSLYITPPHQNAHLSIPSAMDHHSPKPSPVNYLSALDKSNNAATKTILSCRLFLRKNGLLEKKLKSVIGRPFKSRTRKKLQQGILAESEEETEDFTMFARSPIRRQEPCSFRTRISDTPTSTTSTAITCSGFEIQPDIQQQQQQLNHQPGQVMYLLFDDHHCVSVERTLFQGRSSQYRPTLFQPTITQATTTMPPALGTHLYMTPNQESIPNDDDDETDNESLSIHHPTTSPTVEEPNNTTTAMDSAVAFSIPIPAKRQRRMSRMAMPFSSPDARQEQHRRLVERRAAEIAQDLPDDWSVINDPSLIPTYAPADIMRRSAQDVLLKGAINQARTARRRMRIFERTCRSFVKTVFEQQGPASSGPYVSTKCVAVGAVY
ncbi:hypothetical protein B0T17DRAFT_614110 [Bombardia bombarda]|uniref:Uncharacterized protein n=1 Tax=Bombardia bombarda TaxID=252184 RepID=A0AA39X7F1_9PEZI|nr:hypothetical protein B0T17DRAFT_614110 [Bombardia bombarda]